MPGIAADVGARDVAGAEGGPVVHVGHVVHVDPSVIAIELKGA